MRFSSSSTVTEDFQMAPMIDMVFLLLVFFMVVSNLAQLEKGVDLDLAESHTSELAEDFSNRCVVSLVDADDSFLLYLGSKELLIAELGSELVLYKQANANLTVQLRASADCEYHLIDQVLKCCAEAGIFSIIYSTTES